MPLFSSLFPSRRDLFLLGLSASFSSAQTPPPDSSKKAAAPFSLAIGLQSNSLADRDLAGVLTAMKTLRMRVLELSEVHFQPAKSDLAAMRTIRQQCAEARVLIYSASCTFRAEQSDNEILQTLGLASSLDVKRVVATFPLTMMERVSRLALKRSVSVAVHNGPGSGIRTTEDFRNSIHSFGNLGMALDFGHFAASGSNPLELLKRNGAQVWIVHLKDRKMADGPEVAFGEGDAKLRELLRRMWAAKSKTPLMIEVEYPAKDRVAEIRKSLDFCRSALVGK